MRLAWRLWMLCLGMLALWTVHLTYAADLTQPVRNAEFIKACRRQDRELKSFFADKHLGSFSFCHVGSFKAMVHREGLLRSMILVPVESVSFANADGLCAAARVRPLVVGALRMTYGQTDPFLAPGDLLLLYDGEHVHLRDVELLEINHFKAELQPAPPGATVDANLGTLAGTEHSLANASPAGDCQLYLQLADAKRKALSDSAGYSKLMLSFSIPGILTDDDTPQLELVQPEEKEP